MAQIPSLPQNIETYARRIGAFRQRCIPASRNAYTVALGQLVACDLIEYPLYDELMALPYLRKDEDEARVYHIHVCKGCGAQVEWQQRDRFSHGWYCPNHREHPQDPPFHGYLSRDAVERVAVRR